MQTKPHKQPAKPDRTAAPSPGSFDRRALLVGTGAVALGALGYSALNRAFSAKQPVFIASNQRYDGPLAGTIRDGLLATGIKPEMLRGKRVLLKPNLVEPTRLAPHMTTHPAMIVAAAEAFRDFGAKVIVGEAPGHVRDTEMALVEGGMRDALNDAGVQFADLNYEDVVWTPNRGRASKLEGFYFPRSVATADFIVSMPKMKTHHWVGVTAAMKNLYGTIPGIVYGWPKNVLHHNGIPETVYDINASLPQTLAIVDGILCMEGDGPIMGSPKPMGLVIVGPSATAVDATVARIMNLRPENVSYLALAANHLGPIADSRIVQRGERWQDLVKPFSIIDSPHLRSLPKDPGVLIS
jgi:uncharacterized protein (DUF362 family)